MINKTILIVDDAYENLYLLRVILEEVGCLVIEANNGREGLRKLYEHKNVDLIISDILMPIMDGFLFCQACKNEKLFKNIPFVFYTSTYTEKLDEDFALKLGAAKFLRKPIDHDEVTFTLNNIFAEVSKPLKHVKKEAITNEGTLRLYSERLINKLEQKSLDLEREIIIRKKAETLLIQKNEVLDLIAHNTPLNKVFDHILLNYESNNPDYYASISLLHEDGIHLDFVSAPSIPKPYSLAIKRITIGEKVGSCGTAAFTKKLVIVSDISKDKLWEDYKGLALKHKLKSCWSMPILSKASLVLGTFAIYSKIINTPKVEEIEDLKHVVNLAFIAIEKAKIVAEINKRNEAYKSLVNQASDAIVTYSIEGEIFDFNKAAYATLGYDKKEFKTLKLQDFIVGDLIEDQDIYNKMLKGIPVIFNRHLIHKDGTLIDAEISSKLQKNGKILGIARDITERKKAEIKLEENKRSLLEAQKIAKIGSFSFNTNTQRVQASYTFKEIIGLDLNRELTLDIWRAITYPEDAPRNKETFEKSLKTGEKFDLEYRIITKNKKQLKWVHSLGEVVFENGEATKFFGTIQDITERKKVELELKSAKNYSESLINSLHEGLIVYDTNTHILSVNPSFCKMSGFSENELIGQQHPYSFCPPEIAEESKLRHEKAVKGVVLKNFESVYMRKDGKRFNVDVMVSHIDDSEGKMLAYFGTIIDTTMRRKAETKIKESEKSLLVAQKIAKIGNYNYDLNTQLIHASSFFRKIIGIDLKRELTFDIWRTITHPEDTPNNQKTFESCVKTGEKFDLEYRIFTKNKKELKWIHGLGEVVYVNGIATNFIGTIQDITARKKAELELKSAIEFSEKLIMSMQEGLLIINLEGKIIMVNDSLCEILGYSREELVDLNLPYPFAKTEDLEFMLKTKEEVAKGESKSFQLEFIKKNGTKFLISFLSGNIKNDNGEVIALFATLKDISEDEKAKKLLEEVASKSSQKKNVILKLSSLVGSDYHNSLRQITALSAATIDVARVGVWKFNEDKTSISCEKLFVLETGECESGVILNRNDNPNYFDALADNKTISVEDAVNNDITKKFAKDYLVPIGISSMLDVFIQGNQGMYGVICFEHIGAKRKWSADDEEFATSIASIVSLMVESSERKVAENNLVLVNTELSKANTELNKLRDQLEQENSYLRNELDLVFNYEEMVYGSEAFSNVLTEVEKVAPTNATVLLLGESGTGKELLARAIHNTGLRNNKPLIKVNCSAIPRELIESELFGHKKGSFTGAFNDKIGKFELAHEGTLFLDEIGELPLDMQPKILRFLQEGEIEVVGGMDSKKLDVRVIAATNRNLKEEIEKKQFRADLYFRLNVFPIEVPPLRKRIDDIPLLVEHFVDKFNKAYEKDIKYISDDAMDQLKSYNWPGNIRELENLIERAAILSNSSTLVIPGFETAPQKAKQLINNKDSSLEVVQRNHILQILEQCKWKISGPNGAAVLLKLKPSTLRDKMKKLNIIKPLKK